VAAHYVDYVDYEDYVVCRTGQDRTGEERRGSLLRVLSRVCQPPTYLPTYQRLRRNEINYPRRRLPPQ